MGFKEFWEGIQEAWTPSPDSGYTPYQSGDASRAITSFTSKYGATKVNESGFAVPDREPNDYRYTPGDYQSGDLARGLDRWLGRPTTQERPKFSYDIMDDPAYWPDPGQDGVDQMLDEPVVSVQYTAYGANGAIVGDDGFLIPGGTAGFSGASAILAQEDSDLFWESYLQTTGVDQLNAKYGLDTNWFPGMNVQSPTVMNRNIGTAGFYQPGAVDILREQGRLPEAWAVGQLMEAKEVIGYDPNGNPIYGQSHEQYIRYDTSKSTQSYAAMGTNDRGMYTNLMVEAGLLAKGYAGVSDFTIEGGSAFTEATRLANYYGMPLKKFLEWQSELGKKVSGGGGGGGGGGGRRYTIEVPDYATILESAKGMLRSQLGRDPKDWEITLVGDELQRQYGSWADAQKRKALGGNGVYEVPDPQELTQGFIESKYEDEIARLEDVEEGAQNNQLLVAAATKGGNMNQNQNRALRR